jgi:hypothetical protein
MFLCPDFAYELRQSKGVKLRLHATICLHGTNISHTFHYLFPRLRCLCFWLQKIMFNFNYNQTKLQGLNWILSFNGRVNMYIHFKYEYEYLGVEYEYWG